MGYSIDILLEICGNETAFRTSNSRSCENCGDCDNVIVDLSKNFAVHPVHKLSANIEAQPAATNIFRICTAPKALKNMRQIVLAERTATVSDCNLDAFVVLRENQFHAFAITVFEGRNSW